MHQLAPPKPLSWPHKQTGQIFAVEPEKAYVYPFSNSVLGAKSLDMCTESLGTETGSGIDESPHHHYPMIESSGGGAQKKTATKSIEKVKCDGSFPPPLTFFNVQVQTHREGGRLVIKAFAVPSCFRKERGHGRLRLSLIRDGGDEEEEVVNRGGDGRPNANEGEEEEEEEEEVVVRENADGGGGDEGEEVVDQENAASAGGCGGEEGGRVGCVIGGGEWSSSRCNGDRSSRERLKSLPFCVAIS